MQEIILVVDDEPKIVKLARDYLEKNGFRVRAAYDGPTALAAARSECPDLIVLDLLLPGMDGREVCRTLRRESDVPIIMLTALSEETDQVAGLELGADDYLSKPFSPRLLVARVRALLRRRQGQISPPSVLRSGKLEVDQEKHLATLNGSVLHLTPIEFKLLSILIQHPGQTLTRDQLIEDLHSTPAASVDRSIDSHIKNLRHKLEDNTPQARFIETVYGIGYRFLPQE